jgi:hypothetical protein
MTTKGTVTLNDSSEVSVDVSTLKQKEFRGFFDVSVPDKDSDKVVARLTGLKLAQINDLLRDDYRRIMSKIVELANRPLSDPNSQSVSTSDS